MLCIIFLYDIIALTFLYMVCYTLGKTNAFKECYHFKYPVSATKNVICNSNKYLNVSMVSFLFKFTYDFY